MTLQVTNDFAGLREVCRRLRAPDGCSWDRAQTIKSVTPYLLEEVHELLEAIGSGDDAKVAEETGDLLYLLVFVMTMAEEENRFSYGDVAGGIIGKLIRRHPHIFGSESTSLEAHEVRRQWETIKAQEREDAGSAARGSSPDRLHSGARGLPALLDAFRIQEKAASLGFDWPSLAPVLEKLDEERAELAAALEFDPASREAQAELGDLLFTVVNLARHLRTDPEQELRATTARFRRRFGRMEEILEARDMSLDTADLDTMEAAWQEAKGQLAGEDAAAGEEPNQSD